MPIGGVSLYYLASVTAPRNNCAGVGSCGRLNYNLEIKYRNCKNVIPRHASTTLQSLAHGYPILALTGPRQAGKTTLAQSTFPGKPYVSLEDPDTRAFAEEDPRRFLARFSF